MTLRGAEMTRRMSLRLPFAVLFRCQRAGSAWLRALAALVAPELCGSLPLGFARGRREGRAPAGTHGPRATKKHAAEPQVQPKIPGLPCAMVLTASFALSPVTIAWLPPSPVRRVSVFTTLAPASERQDHTISPSARAPVVCRRTRVHRIPPPRS